MNKYSTLRQRGIAAACVAAAAGLLASGAIYAQDDADNTDDTADLGKLEVTGSRIRRLDVEGPSPVVIVTREEMEERGFSSVFEALENLTQNTGTLQGEQYTNSFTPNAQSLSLRSLGGGRTLVLLNGRRVADYPQPFNSQSNFFNFATIPAAAIDRIEVLTGSASAVYGSDAIAGVINVILRDDITAPTVTARYGTTEDGGGDSRLVSAVWGKQWDRSSLMIAAEHQGIDPIFGKDRDYLDDVGDAPQLAGQVPLTRSALVLSNFWGAPTPPNWAGPDPYPGVYYDPGQANCDSLQASGVPYEYAFRAGRGNYCGRDDFGDETLQNERDRNSIYASFKSELTESTSMFVDAMYWDSEASLQGFHLWWGDNVWDPNIANGAGGTGDWVYVQRVFNPAETGNQTNTYDESATNLSAGLEGSFSNFWTWKAGVTYSENEYHQRAARFKEEVADAYFGGSTMTNVCAELGFGCFIPARVVSTAQFSIYDALSQADIDAVMGTTTIDSDSSVWSVYGEFAGDLMEMKHGPLQFAAVVEFASQEYDITPDSRLLDQTGNGWWGLSGTGGGGDRDRSAVGIELGIPLLEELRATVATRYDDYNDNSRVGGAATYGLGLEYRPADTLLLRGSFNTSFRAPDMHYLFADPSGFFQTQRDIWQCRQDAIDAGTTYNELGCQTESVAGNRQGDLRLSEEEGESLTLGFVFSPTNEFTIQVDYFEIELTDAVRDLSVTQLLRDEADCQLGVDVSGNSVDPGSQLCVDTLSRISRTPGLTAIPDLDSVTINPINSSFRKQSGFDALLEYGIATDTIGDFSFRVDYTHVMKDARQVFSTDPVERDFRDNLQNFNSRSTVNVAAGWDYKDFSGVLFAHRLGSLPNWQETGRLPTWTTYNGSATMRFLDDSLTASLLVNNITNERPPYDDGFTTWPFFFRGQYNARGREAFVQLRYVFD